ncbi:MAG: cyclopropane-fatty-acyl-phospholipid synthase family protein [Planctomycetota bacterium]
MSELGAIRMYEALARFQWWRSRRGMAPGSLEGLEIRKRLLPPAPGSDVPADGMAGLDAWLQRRLGKGVSGCRLLDLGCGFGATSFRALQAGAEHVVGVTPSAYQVARAREVAAARDQSAHSRFERQAMNEALPKVDHVVAIEALGHTRELGDVLRNVAASLRAGRDSRFVWLEDLLVADGEELDGDPDVAGLATAWHSPPMRSRAAADAALRAAGFEIVEDVDLTSQVPRRDVAAIERSLRRTRRGRLVTPVPFVRRVLGAFVGGFLLERLYARGCACYRLMVARPALGPATKEISE